MKNFAKSFVLVCSTLFLANCSWRLPESFAIKTDANYNFSVGSVSKDLKEYLSAKAIGEKIQDSSTSPINMELYDYKPEGETTPYRQLIADFCVQKMEFDLSKILPADMDFSTTLGNSFGKPVDSQEIKIPDLASTLNANPVKIDLERFAKEIPQKISFAPISVPIPDRTAAISDEIIAPFTINMAIADGGSFNSIKFSEVEAGSESKSYILVSLTPPASVPADMKAKIGCSLYRINSDSTRTKISYAVPVAISTTSKTDIKLPLDGQSIGSSFALGFEGSITASAGAGLADMYTYSASLKFADTTTLHSITEATMNLSDNPDGPLNFKKEIPSLGFPMFVECTIGNGNFAFECEQPSGWSGITFTPNLSISGGIAKSDGSGITNADFTNGTGSGTYILNKVLNLSGLVYKNTTISIDGKIAVALNNATVIFKKDEMVLEVVPKCEISTINSAIANLKDFLYDISTGESKLKYTINYDLASSDSAIKQYIKYIKLDSGAGITLPYSNTLPVGNDIGIKYNSNFLSIGTSSSPLQTTLNSYGEQKNADGVSDFVGKLEFLTSAEKEIDPGVNHKVDFTVEMVLPGRAAIQAKYGNGAEYNYYTVLSNVQLGATYKLNIEKPVASFKWIEAGIKKSAVGSNFKKTVDTGFSVSNMMASVADAVGTSDFLEHIKVETIPMYVYFVAPGLTTFNEMGFKCSVIAKADESGTILNAAVFMGNEVKDSAGNLTGVTPQDFEMINSIPALDSDENLKEHLVTKKLDETKASAYKEVKHLLNTNSSGTIKMQYAMSIGGSGDTFVLKKEMFDSLSSSSETPSTGIELRSRIIVPLRLKVDTDDDKPVGISVMKLLNKGIEKPDIFGRTEATNMDSAMKFINAIEYAELSYSVKNELINYDNPSTAFMISLDPKISGMNTFDFQIGASSIRLTPDDLNKMLKTYPFKPDLKIVLPKGTIQVLEESTMGITANIKIKTNGTVQFP